MMNYLVRIILEELFRKKPGMPELFDPASLVVSLFRQLFDVFHACFIKNN
jgi:hypothetical protein